MKINVDEKTPVPAYVPKTITIKVESIEEEVGLRHLIDCGVYEGCPSCEHVDDVREKLRPMVYRMLSAYIP